VYDRPPSIASYTRIASPICRDISARSGGGTRTILLAGLARTAADVTTPVAARLARHLYSFRARQILITHGQQTLGVALPWGIAASIVRPADKVLSISGDGGFLFSAMELETAVRLKANIVHMVWIDGTYDMVGAQEMLKYGQKSASILVQWTM
jgi:thiamine pyrophosphate-dependent acetolactate synthase large subunit-like protein